jgi:protein-tyrosine-phosphatase
VADLALIGLQVASAGTHGLTGHPATKEMQVVGAEMGLDLSGHRAARVDARLLENASLIYGMETDHLAWLRSSYPDRPAALLAPAGIDDPYGSSLPEYRRAAREIVDGVQFHVPEMAALAG